MKNSIFTVLVCNKLEKEKGLPNLGSSRLVGFDLKEEDAVNDVINNALGIDEYCYNYAIIEKINEGFYGCDCEYKKRVFKFDREEDKFKEIECPSFLHQFIGLTIG